MPNKAQALFALHGALQKLHAVAQRLPKLRFDIYRVILCKAIGGARNFGVLQGYKAKLCLEVNFILLNKD